MMSRLSTVTIERGTPKDLIRAAALGARIAVRKLLAQGRDEMTIRQEIIARFRADLHADSYGAFEDETLMAAVQRATERALARGRRCR
jgi:hypothetical protein